MMLPQRPHAEGSYDAPNTTTSSPRAITCDYFLVYDHPTGFQRDARALPVTNAVSSVLP